MAKQTYYEILGIPQDAAADAVEQAYAAQKQLLQTHSDLEHRRNQLAFIQHARDVLVDDKKRAHYDSQFHAEQPMVVVEATSPLPLGRVFLMTILVGTLVFWWLHDHHSETPLTSPVNNTLVAAKTPDHSEDNEDKNIVFETPAAEGDKPPPTAAGVPPTPAATPPKKTYQIRTTATDAELVKKLIWSVYAVVGARGFGTGVMVDGDHLLTNCHVIAANVHTGKMFAINAVTKDRAEITDVAYLDHQDACLLHAAGLTGHSIDINVFAQPISGFKTHNIGYANGRLISSEGEFTGWAYKFGQKFLVSNNFCDHGVSGGPLVDDDGRLVGLTTGGPPDKSYCLSVTSDTINSLKFEPSRPLDQFPDNYTSNVSRRS